MGSGRDGWVQAVHVNDTNGGRVPHMVSEWIDVRGHNYIYKYLSARP